MVAASKILRTSRLKLMFWSPPRGLRLPCIFCRQQAGRAAVGLLLLLLLLGGGAWQPPWGWHIHTQGWLFFSGLAELV